ncbi:hypothetical protein H2201_008211 [Coniosporium apollinis]|uniref:Copper acquisition factor BIM1-like domain-containing protein n=1 Tax=Coniosporium apollinis TaxID=61459 RepID=A0ABQ9NJR1_9PEZI|nr:hypothetical protein H2201_008211 [Coniosporium apollinis]
MLRLPSLIAFLAIWSLVAAHTVVTYPGWRGNNLVTNGTTVSGSIPEGSLGINYVDGQPSFPYGMQWQYPCGGMPMSRNRTKWPVTGGAIGVQPGWFSGHATALFYINMGFGNEPMNYSHNLVPVFQIAGPSNSFYHGSFCLPRVSLPPNVTVNVGDNATIQIIETAVHGAALYNCVDITFTEPEDVPQVNKSNCENSTLPGEKISFNLLYTTPNQESAAPLLLSGSSSLLALLPAMAGTLAASLWL